MDRYTTSQAARVAGCHANTIRRAIERGELAVTGEGRSRRIDGDSLAAWIESRQEPETVASIAGVELTDIRFQVVSGEPFFCVDDVRAWLGSATDSYRLVESTPEGHALMLPTTVPLNLRSGGGTSMESRAMWHVSIGGLVDIIGRVRSKDELAQTLHKWALDVVRDVALGRRVGMLTQDLTSADGVRTADRLRRATCAAWAERAVTQLEHRRALREICYRTGLVSSPELPRVEVQLELTLLRRED